MQAKLRIFGLLVVANVMWIPPTSAATTNAKPQKTAKKLKVCYLGTASWYGEQHQGRKMANGKRFDRHNLTAASWYFPLGTTVRVVNLKNGESVIVTITDRGPNLRLHRILDLSEAAAQRLDYVGQGLTSVFLSPVTPIETMPAQLHSQLAEPRILNAAEYETTTLQAPM